MIDIQINSPEIELTGVMRSAIHDHIGSLRARSGNRQLESCHVVIARPGGPGRTHPYQVRVHVTLPGHDLSATNHEDGNFFVAINRAFEALRHQLHSLDRVRYSVSPKVDHAQL